MFSFGNRSRTGFDRWVGDRTALHCTALQYLGMSCRQSAEVLLFSDDASHEAVRQWYHWTVHCFVHNPSKRYRRAIAINETKNEVERRWRYSLWAAIDSDNREALGIKNIGATEHMSHPQPQARLCSWQTPLNCWLWIGTAWPLLWKLMVTSLYG